MKPKSIGSKQSRMDGGGALRSHGKDGLFTVLLVFFWPVRTYSFHRQIHRGLFPYVSWFYAQPFLEFAMQKASPQVGAGVQSNLLLRQVRVVG